MYNNINFTFIVLDIIAIIIMFNIIKREHNFKSKFLPMLILGFLSAFMIMPIFAIFKPVFALLLGNVINNSIGTLDGVTFGFVIIQSCTILMPTFAIILYFIESIIKSKNKYINILLSVMSVIITSIIMCFIIIILSKILL